MFKNMLKRSWLSIIRKPGRSILIGLILFAMANLVLSTITIKSAVNEQVDFAKSSLGGTVTLQPDMAKIRQAAESEMQSGTLDQSNLQSKLRAIRPTVSKDVADEIAQSDYVKDYSYGLTNFANSDQLEPVETTNPMGGLRLNVNGNSASLTGEFSVQGINAYAFISGVKDGTMSIAKDSNGNDLGTYFDESTNDSAIISYDVADENDIAVGDKIKLLNVDTEATVELTVIGIYDTTDDQANPNAIFMNVDTAAKFLDEETYADGKYGVQNVRYELVNAENADAFIAEINQAHPELAEDNLAPSVDDSAYEQMVGPIESVGSFASTILWIVVVASVAIITLIVINNVKDRRYEMGVLLSLGAKKTNIMGQVLVELVIAGTLAFVVSIGTSSFIAQAMGSSLLDSQVAASEQQSEQNFGRPGAISGGGIRLGGGFGQARANVEAIDSIDINVSPADYALLFAIGYGVIVLALLLPTWNIVKYQPKTILSGKE